ncbi:S1/P1 nuclease [Aliifodinibius sp. S!AR15-10]|uniref:S1/P1 nuclease n=1 Tax=Aliifodinibius sp. S!AR15-10 TaxID=2950437 RepID=UPI00286775E4|nr:S1/P1 nuclease [Aliifodinibius sp. S!AR15-10]MDR8391248.1 S1/P1 nuclease [Aliifodinibius sp. S!AR15-10]
MKTLIILLSLLFTVDNVHSAEKWGRTGHRVVGDIAAEYLTPLAKKEIKQILGDESLAMASTWMDEIRSDPQYDHTHDWHWVTIPDGQTYAETEKNPNGDLVKALQDIISDLKQGDISKEEEAKKLKMLIHLVGDIHQPLHVGTGEDRGGNAVEVQWFWEPSNLHRVWDSEMIDDSKLSYTELSKSINHPTQEKLREWQSTGVLDWARESMQLRDQVYNLPDDMELGYEYTYKNFDTVEKRLLQAGIRLADVLNEIYGG